MIINIVIVRNCKYKTENEVHYMVLKKFHNLNFQHALTFLNLILHVAVLTKSENRHPACYGLGRTGYNELQCNK